MPNDNFEASWQAPTNKSKNYEKLGLAMKKEAQLQKDIEVAGRIEPLLATDLRTDPGTGEQVMRDAEAYGRALRRQDNADLIAQSESEMTDEDRERIAAGQALVEERARARQEERERRELTREEILAGIQAGQQRRIDRAKRSTG